MSIKLSKHNNISFLPDSQRDILLCSSSAIPKGLHVSLSQPWKGETWGGKLSGFIKIILSTVRICIILDMINLRRAMNKMAQRAE